MSKIYPEKTITQRLKSISGLDFVLAGAVLLLPSCMEKQKISRERPNILFITTDYQAWEDTPFTGSPYLDMPAIKKLGRQGVILENHYCTAPISMPSRYSIITGQYPHSHGMWDNGSGWIPEDSPILMEELKKAGYYSIGIGKMHFKPWDRLAGFDRRIIADRKGNWKGDNNFIDDYASYLSKAGLTRWDYLKYQDSSEIFGVYDWPYDDSLHIDYYVGDQTVNVIKKHELKEPWFMWASFNGPHNPWDPPAVYSDFYKNMDLPDIPLLLDELESKPYDHTVLRYNYTRKVSDLLDKYPERNQEILKEIRAGHYGGLTFIDRQIEKIIKELKKSGKLKNTIIIFTSDHGCSLGENNNIHKGSLYERSAHVPMIVWNPIRFKSGAVKGFSNHIDIMPTILSLAGVDIPRICEGVDISPLLNREKENVQDYAIIEIRNNYAIVTEKYKMGLYSTFREGDLYDRENDPNEWNNLYYNISYKHVVDSLTRILYNFNVDIKAIVENAPERKDKH